MVLPGIKHWSWALLMAMAAVLPARAFSLMEGDLLFCCSDTANAITSVTCGVGDSPIDHVAVVHRLGGDDGEFFVIEAVKPAVRLTPIDEFLAANPSVIVGRLNVEIDYFRSIRNCLMMLGRPYDDLYLPGDSAVYCSELVQLNYVTPAGDLVFDPVPMSFHDNSGRVTDYWQAFYAGHGMAVPEGEPGSNPGELSCRPQITVIGTITTRNNDILFQQYR